ncbi:MAG: M48 family metalloprotease [Candidatus Aenigmarchaeota archaeon]|nr:M48 family metalloprotease [Candidatus Aenigmarchaeota archaeon]
MIIGCLAGIPLESDKLILMGFSLIIAVATFIPLKKFNLSTKSKVALIYGHIIAILFPIVLFTTNVLCGTGCMPCYNNMYSLIALSLPTTLIIGTVISLFVIPGIYIVYYKKSVLENIQINKFVENQSKRLKITKPEIYTVNTANPLAFSFRSFKSGIFLSAGLLDILKKREVEAVILHELGHIKRKASLLTSSISILKFFTPFSLLARFHYDSYKEEKYADSFAIRKQKSSKWLKSAKRKLDEFERQKL